jgi:hypothetical protein
MTILNASFTCTTHRTGTASHTGFLTPYLLKRDLCGDNDNSQGQLAALVPSS